jgi:hypothetical protein
MTDQLALFSEFRKRAMAAHPGVSAETAVSEYAREHPNEAASIGRASVGEPVAKAAPVPGAEAALRLDELVNRYAEAAGISKVDAFPIALETREGATYAAAAYREQGDFRKAAQYHATSQTAAPFWEAEKVAKAARERDVVDRLLAAQG